ncbi:MAG TPA: ABC transporter ATP-binding protein [Stellaceae bacterium]|nr:ABC transporter ATP-binding protein [Stellaceae bacterium]
MEGESKIGISGFAGAAVRLENVSKSFGSVAAVKELNLGIEPGEFITLLGPSGSGKTTTLMMIAGFDYPNAGEIYIDGQPIVAVPPYRRGIGMVFQNYALFPHMTVAENIGFALKQRGIAKAEIAGRVAETLETVRLRGYEGRYPRQLSGGQQQRVALARAIIFKPRVLLMDEPLSALDKKLREELQLEMKHLHRRLGITFIYVTHDQREALVMSDRVAVMNEGRIAQLGSPSELYDRPADRFVASFIGESNFLEGTVLDSRGDAVTVGIAGANVTAISAAPPPAGATVMLAIRPEKLAFRDDDGRHRAGEVNSLAVSVREVSFVGEMHRYTLDIEGGPTLVLKQQHRFAVRPRAAGERASVEWHVNDTLIV